MEDKYIIQARYEYHSREDIQFTNWYTYDSTPITLEEANNKIEQLKEEVKDIDKKTKLNHEYRPFLLSEYEKIKKDIHKQYVKDKKKMDDYLKSDEYKRIQKIKRINREANKIRQQKYLEEHQDNGKY